MRCNCIIKNIFFLINFSYYFESSVSTQSFEKRSHSTFSSCKMCKQIYTKLLILTTQYDVFELSITIYCFVCMIYVWSGIVESTWVQPFLPLDFLICQILGTHPVTILTSHLYKCCIVISTRDILAIS